jgi:hypothetical protein
MKQKTVLLMAVLAVFAVCTQALADQIILKNGTRYSGKFLRGTSTTIEFQILGRSESFNISEIAQILFQEPELTAPSTTVRTPSTPPIPAAPPVPSNVPSPATPPVPASPPKAAATVAPSPENVPESKTAPTTVVQDASGLTLPTGTPITIRTMDSIDTDKNKVGDTFEASLEDPISAGGQTIGTKGTPVKGRIAWSRESGKVTGQSELILELTDITFNGKQYTLHTSDYQQVGSSTGRRTATAAGGGAALGAIIGAIAGGGKGAAIGAGVGAAAGTGAAVLTRGQTLKVPAETLLEFKLQSPLTLPNP